MAHCPALELSSYGKDEGTARKRFGEELEIFFEETLQIEGLYRNVWITGAGTVDTGRLLMDFHQFPEGEQ